jgi:LuxR family maltose regulon positive regulatory protein
MSTSISNPPAWIARTKLHPPQLRADAIERPRLLESLSLAVTSNSVTLISAPAGSGKTTLLASWLTKLRNENEELRKLGQADDSQFSIFNSQFNLAWLALDEGDDDPTSFVLALIAALGQLHPDCGASLLQWLASGGAPSAESRRFAGALVNEIMRTLPEPFVLVLDDLHALAAPPIFTLLDHLIERMPPHMRVILATRHEPALALGRLRARRQIAELHLDDLRFTLEETEQLLNEVLHLRLSPVHLRLLQERTEGWVAGIGMLAGSLNRLVSAEDRGVFLAHVERAGRYVFDFLADEVLGRQDPFVRMFLLETSILPDLTPSACQAVTGRSDAAAILDQLYRRNLFLVEIRNGSVEIASARSTFDQSSYLQPSTYRYHDLFRDFLRERLARELPEWVRQLHGRAAKSEPLPARRIQHYLAAELWDDAADAIEQIGEGLLAQGGGRTLHSWIEAIPLDVCARRPQLLYLLGLCARAALEWNRAEMLFAEARDRFVEAGDLAGEGAALAQLATLLLFMAYRPRAIAAARRALECPLAPYQRAQVYLTSAWVELGENHFDAVLADLEGAASVAETNSDPRVLAGLALLFHAPLAVAPGAIQRIERLERFVNQRAGGQAGMPGAIALGLSAHVLCWRGRWDQAAASARRIVALGDQIGGLGLLWGVSSAQGLLALDAAFHGDQAASEQAYEALFAGMDQSRSGPTGTWSAFYRLTRARARWLAGQLEPLRAIYSAIAGDPPAPDRWSPTVVARPLLQGMLALAEGRHAEAERALKAADELQRRDGTTILLGRAAMLLAHLYRVTGRAAAALGAIAPVLAQCAADDTPGLLFWDGPAIVAPLLQLASTHGVQREFANRTLELIDNLGFETTGAAMFNQAAGMEEPLTPREVEIMRLLAAGASNQVIAETLVISLHTVKRHITHILGKLDVSSRLEAVARARELRIIP